MSSSLESDQPHRLLIAERFLGCERLCQISLPLDWVQRAEFGFVDIVILCLESGERRRVSLPLAALGVETLFLRLPVLPFTNPDPALFTLLIAADADGVACEALLAEANRLEIETRALITLETDTVPIEPGPTIEPEPPPPLAHLIEFFWVDRRGVYLEGWLHAFDRPIRSAAIEAGSDPAPLGPLTERPDVLAQFPESPLALNSGFRVYAPWRPGHEIAFRIELEDEALTYSLDLPRLPDESVAEAGASPTVPGPHPSVAHFVEAVNERRLSVVEIGARKVSAQWTDNRALMPSASRFVGVDIHEGPGVDLVGDAHFLDKLLAPETVDAAFSLSVLEHLARPWLFAASLNRVLRVGGITLHATHQTWPMHEEPNDFWRFSDEALKVLFGPEFGFEVLEAGMGEKMAIYPDLMSRAQWRMPLVSAFGLSVVLARKVRNLGPDGGWVAAERSVAQARTYPRRD